MSGQRPTPLYRELDSATVSWRLLATPANAVATPADLPPDDSPDWLPAEVPGTAASALRALGQWSWEKPRNFDQDDWWYETEIEIRPEETGLRLLFEGLATLCEVWLDERYLAHHENMFTTLEIPLAELAPGTHRLRLCFRSLDAALTQKRPRPAWKTRLIDHQNLRWFRTTLLGRIPGWSPPVHPVGPWRPVRLISSLQPRQIQLRPEWRDGQAWLFAAFEIDAACKDCRASLEIGGRVLSVKGRYIEEAWHFEMEQAIEGLDAWMPHTHGAPHCYPARLRLQVDGRESLIELPALGFRRVEVDVAEHGFALIINGLPVFCRGACWTVNDLPSMNGDIDKLRDTLTQMRDAGCNMIRVGGTMAYEQDDFYALCDELGILVWQDFMFANMDYPADDEAFLADVLEEAGQQLRRLSAHACVAVYCGNSEVEQQATMMGVPPQQARNPLFHEQLPKLCERLHPGIPYVPSTPWDEDPDVLPFRNHRGLAHYYGIGAYQRPLCELRSHDVRFTPECLGFAHVPSSSLRKRLFDNETALLHHPLWKQRTPRDANAGWDFEDVRDFYLKQLLSLDPAQLRYEQPEFYWRVSEFVSGEVLRRVFAEWRSRHSRCRGALLWFLKDLWPGAGWGVIDSDGEPKLAWYALQRSWQSRGLCITDESVNGLEIHVYNEREQPLEGRLSLLLFNEQGVRLLDTEAALRVDARSTGSWDLERLIGHFFDLNYSYRFGPRPHQLLALELIDEQGQSYREHYLPESRLPCAVGSEALKAEARVEDGRVRLQLRADRLLYGLQIECRGFRVSDQGFHLAPGEEVVVWLDSRDETLPSRMRIDIQALNLSDPVSLRLKA